MDRARVLECGCGDTKPLSQIFLRCTGGGDHGMRYVVECIDCTISAGADIDDLVSMEDALNVGGEA